jgi:hypothetical protein
MRLLSKPYRKEELLRAVREAGRLIAFYGINRKLICASSVCVCLSVS